MANKTAGATATALFRNAYYGMRYEVFDLYPENQCAAFKKGFANAHEGMRRPTAVYYDVSSSYPASMMVKPPRARGGKSPRGRR